MPDYICSASETITDIVNYCLQDPSSSFTIYPSINSTYSTRPSPTASPSHLQHTNTYMEDLLCLSQGDPLQETRVTKLAIHDIKYIFPSLHSETKDSVSLNKSLAGGGNWAQLKNLLVWVLSTLDGTLYLSSKRRSGHISLLIIPTTQRHISRKYWSG